MSKNIFSALKEKSDSENEEKQQQVHKPTKKERREDDKQKREHFGDQVVKDQNQKDPLFDGPKIKDDYESGEKRPFERHSGTGKPAFVNNYKKGGHGKGNVGKEEEGATIPKKNQKDDEEDKKEAEKNVAPPEPKEEIMTVEEYMAKNGTQFEFLKKEEEKKSHPIVIQDKTVKLVEPKHKDEVSYTKKNQKNLGNVIQANTNILVSEEQKTYDPKRKASKKNIKTEFNEQNFPALS